MNNASLRSRGFSLVEVTVALGITGFCALALFGLLPVGIASNRASITQSGAANIATSLVADLRATKIASPATDQISLQYKVPVPATATQTHTLFFRADGKIVGNLDANANPGLNPYYRAMLVIGKDPKGTATDVRILITWPALGDAKANVTPTTFAGSFETVFALNRN